MSTSREETPWAEAPSSWSCRHAWPAPPSLAVGLPATHSRAGRFSKWKRWVPPPSSTAGQPARFPAHGLPFSPTQREAGKRPREENTERAQNWHFLNRLVFRVSWAPRAAPICPYLSLPWVSIYQSQGERDSNLYVLTLFLSTDKQICMQYYT